MKQALSIIIALVGIGCSDLPTTSDNTAVDERSEAIARKRELTVAHVTDPHIFDDKSKNVTPERLHEGCLNLRFVDHAITEINKHHAKEIIDAVVVTGDLGVEKLIEAAGIECKKAKVSLDEHGKVLFDGVSKDKEIHELLNQHAQAFAQSISKSDVTDWLFVNGNNDLCNEDVRTLRYFTTYLANVALALRELNNKIKIHNLVAEADHVVVFVPPHARDHVLIGFENGSFKNNHSAAYADGINKQFQENILTSLEEEIAHQEQAKKKIHLVFHAPHFDDPFNASTAHKDCAHRLPTNVVFEDNCAVSKPKIPGNQTKHLYSAWLLPDQTRTKWDALVSKESVKTLFAGHFHSQTREHYLNPAGYQTEDYKNLEKYNVAPPISIKNQTVESNVNQARGFSIVTLKKDGGRKVTFFWSNQLDNGACHEIRLSPWTKEKV